MHRIEWSDVQGKRQGLSDINPAFAFSLQELFRPSNDRAKADRWAGL